MATQYNPGRPEMGAPARRPETANRPYRAQSAPSGRYGDARPRPQRPAGSPPPRRQQPHKRKPSGRFYALLCLLIVAIIAAIVIVSTVAKPNSDPSSNVIPATDAPTANPTDATGTDAAMTASQTAEPSHSEALAALLGSEDGAIEGLSAEEMTQIEDLNVNSTLPDEWLNVLFLGSDERTLTESARTDSMIICSIHRTTGEVKLTSIMRDLAVYYDEIGEYAGTYRINAANYFGGENLAMRIVNECFNLNIEHYVRVNFYGFQQIAQQLGGVEMDITQAEMEEINYRIYEQAKIAYKNGIDESALPNQWLETYGENTHLDGRQTLAYARIRKLDGGDYARSERQRKVLVALMNKLQGADAATLLNVANAALPHIKTNLSPDMILNIGLKVLQSGLTDVESFRLPVNNSYTQETRNGQDMLYDCDWAKNTSELYYFIYE